MWGIAEVQIKPVHKFDVMIAYLPARIAMGWQNSPMLFDLRRQLRASKVTIRELKAGSGITLKRIREVAAMERVPFLIALDFQEAIEKVARGKQ